MRYIRGSNYSVCIRNFHYKDSGHLTEQFRDRLMWPVTVSRFWFVTTTICPPTMEASDCNRFPRTCTTVILRLNRMAFPATFLPVTHLATLSGTTSTTRTCWQASHRVIRPWETLTSR